jgi:LysM repeat protein
MKFNPVLVTLAAVGLAACGSGDGSGSDQTVLGLTSTNYVTVTQTPTTLTPTTVVGATIAPGTVHPEESTYVIATGDYPSTIAGKFKVKFEDLLAINGWTLVGDQVPEYPAIGTTIKIPPNWTEPGTVTDTSTDSATPSETTTTVAGGVSTCAPGEYTIVEGDFEGKVAKKLDTTVDALRAANASTPNYASFYPGLKIKTPPKANC